ncbi:MAG: GIY-YIG nuclease family protein, partial [Acidaminobacteraceae bacterium]
LIKKLKYLEKALEKARKEILTATEGQIIKLKKEIEFLIVQLEEAESNKRAISQAQITKSGFVYVISNVGAFGENVYKIGMTRRLEPFDRITELNGPSVPFKFDVHAMIFSKNAPNLETLLHKKLSKHKMNRVNTRKEFFEVDLKKIESTARKIDEFESEFIHDHEAKEYRQSVAIKKEKIDKAS